MTDSVSRRPKAVVLLSGGLDSYEPGEDGKPCGAFDSCLLRAKGFAEAGVSDPLYVRFGMA